MDENLNSEYWSSSEEENSEGLLLHLGRETKKKIELKRYISEKRRTPSL